MWNGFRERMGIVPSLKGLAIFSYLTQGLRLGLNSIPPLRGWILRNCSTPPTQTEFSHTLLNPGSMQSWLFSWQREMATATRGRHR